MCLEDWSDEMKEAWDHKELWYKKMKDKGLGVKIAVTEGDKVVGMIQYIPWGIADALFIDEKEIRTGPPPSYEDIKKKIAKRVKKLK